MYFVLVPVGSRQHRPVRPVSPSVPPPGPAMPVTPTPISALQISPDVFRQRQRHFFADCAVCLDHQRRYVGKQRLQFVRVDDRATQEGARTAGDRGDTFGDQSSRAGFRDRDFGIAHLQIQTDNLFQGLSTSRRTRRLQTHLRVLPPGDQPQPALLPCWRRWSGDETPPAPVLLTRWFRCWETSCRWERREDRRPDSPIIATLSTPTRHRCRRQLFYATAGSIRFHISCSS